MSSEIFQISNDRGYDNLKDVTTHRISGISKCSKQITKKNLDPNYKALATNYLIEWAPSSEHLNLVKNFKIDQIVQLCFNGFNQACELYPEDSEAEVVRFYQHGKLVCVLVNYVYIAEVGLSVQQFIEAARQNAPKVLSSIDQGNPTVERQQTDNDVYFDKLRFPNGATTIEQPVELDQTMVLEEFLDATDYMRRNKYRNPKPCSFRLKRDRNIKLE